MDKDHEAKGEKRSKIHETQRTSTVESLPRKIMIDILSRLPLTSHIHVKSVCRSWRKLAQDTLLARIHYQQKVDNDPGLILLSDLPFRNRFHYISNTNGNAMTLERIPAPILPMFNVVGSCHGLLCLCDSQTKSTFYICNPFTGDFLKLPQRVYYPGEQVVFGLGFCAAMNEYKVIRIVYHWNFQHKDEGDQHMYPGRRLPSKSELQVLSLGRSPAWRIIGEVPHQVLQRPSPVMVNGRLHWLTCCNRYQLQRRIVSFDLGDERIREVPVPDCRRFRRDDPHLVNLAGCLSAVVYFSINKIGIWVMKEYGVEESWTLEFSIDIYVPRGLAQEVKRPFKLSWSYTRVLCLLKNGELLLEYKRRVLVSYNPNCETFKELQFPGLPDSFESVVHIGSLNWIDSPVDL